MTTVLVGGVVLSGGLRSVALVRSAGKASWLFPCGPGPAPGAADRAAAQHVVHRQLGLPVALSDEALQVRAPSRPALWRHQTPPSAGVGD